jgi:hypothetical protein
MRRFLPLFVCCGLAMLVFGGCSAKEHGHVTGVVKINGEAVEGAEVSFAPKEGGRTAFAVTGADGSYELEYTAGVKGAKLGPNTITLTSYVEPELDDDDKVVEPAKPERFPPEYNAKASETRDVVPGDNVFDFDVKADQESYKQPRNEDD